MGQKHYAAMAIVGVVAAGLGGVIGVISLLNAVGATHGAGSAAHYTVLAVLALGIAVLGAGMAVYAEHQLHHLPGGRYAWALSQAWRAGHPGGPAGGRRRAHAPGTLAGAALITTAMACFGLVATLQAHSGAQRSSYTQAHGVTETAVADDVENIASHTSKGSYSYTNQITITVQHPAVGDGSATVYGNGQTSVQSGDTLTVLVDPKQPSYAEMPGAPYYTTRSWIEALLFTIVIGGVSVFLWCRAGLMLLRHRRVSRGQLHVVGA